MTPPRRREKLIPDGVSVQFETVGTYVPTTVFVFWNGQLMRKEFVVELGGRSFEICEIIPSGDSLQVDYQPVL